MKRNIKGIPPISYILQEMEEGKEYYHHGIFVGVVGTLLTLTLIGLVAAGIYYI